jgi:hypothetical protein
MSRAHRTIRARMKRARSSDYRPRLEALEVRCLPSIITVTSTADSGSGTLRSALINAQNGDTITFNLPKPSTIQLTSTSLSVNGTVTIAGPGPAALTINGNQTFSDLVIGAAAKVTMAGLTISDGGSGASGGGGINDSAGGILTLSNCVISGNSTTASGGGISTGPGQVTINNCAISHNNAQFGGGIFGAGPITIYRCTISSNTASSGGAGINSDNANLVLQNSQVIGNQAASATHVQGGGVDYFSAGQGQVSIINCLIAGNSATGLAAGTMAQGGGLNIEGQATIVDSTIFNNQAIGGSSTSSFGGSASGGGVWIATKTASLINCTISDNTAMGGNGSTSEGTGQGGGIDEAAIGGGQATVITNCTVTRNSAATPGAFGFGLGSGMIADGTNQTTDLQNTIIAGNFESGASDADFDNQGDTTNAFNNLIGDGAGSNIANGTNGNQVGTNASPIDPKLLPLANYGGPTATFALLPGSPAIDAGGNGFVTTSTDQRGLPRVFGANVDIGAFEFQPLHFLAVGADLGGGPEVKVFDASTGALRLDFDAYEPTFKGGVRLAVADMNGDGIPDIITAPGGVKVTLVNVNGALVPSFDFSAGRSPEVKVFSGVDGSLLDDFIAFTPSFRAGLFVAVADVNGDGKPDIITAPDATGQSGHTQVNVFFNGSLVNTAASLTPDRTFNAYDPGFGGGVRLAAADFNSDGFADIVTAPGIWSGPDIRIFDGKTLATTGTGSKIGEFLAYAFRYFGGVFVSTGDVNGDGLTDIITGTNGNGGPEVKAFSGLNVLSSPTPTVVDDFFAYDPAFNGGARVAVMDVNGDGKADIITGAGPGGGPHVRIFDGGTGLQLQQNTTDSFMAFDPSFSGGIFVGAGS